MELSLKFLTKHELSEHLGDGSLLYIPYFFLPLVDPARFSLIPRNSNKTLYNIE